MRLYTSASAAIEANPRAGAVMLARQPEEAGATEELRGMPLGLRSMTPE